MTEPNLPTLEEFAELASYVDEAPRIEADLNAAYVAAYELVQTQAKRIDVLMEAGNAALASLVDARTKFEAMLGEPVCHCGDAVSAHSERSNHSPVELWPPEVEAVFKAFRSAATPGRGEKLLGAVEAARDVATTLRWRLRLGANQADRFAADEMESLATLDEAYAALDADGAAS